MARPAVVFIVGGPGAGKGTQCQKLVQDFGYLHLSAGDLLRVEVKSGSERGRMIEGLMKEGKIVPSEITIELLKKSITANPQCKFFLVDGFPRNIKQGDMFEESVVPCRFLLNLDCSEKVMEERLLSRAKGGEARPDDNVETIRKRFYTHAEQCLPVLAHYEKMGKLRQVDASKSADQVYTEIKRFFTEQPTARQ